MVNFFVFSFILIIEVMEIETLDLSGMEAGIGFWIELESGLKVKIILDWETGSNSKKWSKKDHGMV